MKSVIRLKERLFLTGLIFSATSFAYTEFALGQTNQKNEVKEFVKVQGKPVTITLADGRVIGAKVGTSLTSLESTIVLSDNSCTTAVGTKVGYTAPLFVKALIPYWLKHPTKQGQLVLKQESEEDGIRVASVTAMYTRMNDPQFTERIRALNPQDLKSQNLRKMVLNSENAVGWLSCPQDLDCRAVAPKTDSVLFWDENFETGNSEIMMPGVQGANLNQMTTRFEQVPLRFTRSHVFFDLPKETYGFFSMIFPPGITYQIQWSFVTQNLVDPDDSICQMKWDMDFTRVFTDFQKQAQAFEDPKIVKMDLYKDYLFDPEDPQKLGLMQFFENFQWDWGIQP